MLSGENDILALHSSKTTMFKSYKYLLNHKEFITISILYKNTFLIPEHLPYQN